MKSKRCPTKCWLAHVNSLKKDKILEIHVKLIKEAHDKRECEKFKMTLQHKSKLCVYKESK